MFIDGHVCSHDTDVVISVSTHGGWDYHRNDLVGYTSKLLCSYNSDKREKSKIDFQILGVVLSFC